jgi:AcrR family transcriptional regulator
MTPETQTPAVAGRSGLRHRLSSQQRRAVILDSAARVFAERGYHAASISEIARMAGITKPVIYHHVASKHELHSAVFEHYATELLSVAAAHGRHGSPRERFHDLVSGMFAFAHSRPHIWQLLLGDSTDPETAGLQQQLRDLGTSASAQRLLSEPTFQPAAGLSRRQAAEVIAELTRSAVDGLVTWSLRHPNVSRAALINSAVDLLWPGLLNTTSTAPIAP